MDMSTKAVELWILLIAPEAASEVESSYTIVPSRIKLRIGNIRQWVKNISSMNINPDIGIAA